MDQTLNEKLSNLTGLLLNAVIYESNLIITRASVGKAVHAKCSATDTHNLTSFHSDFKKKKSILKKYKNLRPNYIGCNCSKMNGGRN